MKKIARNRGMKDSTCRSCHGTGQVDLQKLDANGKPIGEKTKTRCPKCGGNKGIATK